MIKDRVKNNHAQLYCTECNAECEIIQYGYDERYKSAMIDYPKSGDMISLFIAKHTLCKLESVQLELVEKAEATESQSELWKTMLYENLVGDFFDEQQAMEDYILTRKGEAKQ